MNGAQIDECIAKLADNLGHINAAIRRITLRALQSIGRGKQEVLSLILPLLVDTEVGILPKLVDTDIGILPKLVDKDVGVICWRKLHTIKHF